MPTNPPASGSYTPEDFEAFITGHHNWGRWGADDELGTLNLITAEKRILAAGLVRTGDLVSLSRPITTTPGPSQPHPPQRHVWTDSRGSADYLGMAYHGFAITHLDALCHSWSETGMYNGLDPATAFTGADGAIRLDIDRWGDGISTRAVLLDVPAHRGTAYVEADQPVHGWELAEICERQGVNVTPGDAVVVYSGRDAYDATHDDPWDTLAAPRPGLSPSCLEFLRTNDAAVLVWDMLEQGPYDTRFTVHAAIYMLGMALIDNAALDRVVGMCREQQRYEFQLTVAPLRIQGGTGSPVNPLALL